jgi:penicillin-binding protein 1C
MALGTGGASLLEVTNAYHRLPEVFSPETEILLASMLRRPLPHTSLDVAWKTGTSNHHTDAWCVGWTPEFVVGVWFGNKSGERSEALVGVELAAPVVGDLFNLLYIGRPHPFWDEPSSTQMLCEATGLRAAPHCQKRKSGFVHPRYPLLQCTCWKTPHPTTPLILSPLSATYCGNPVSLPLISTHTNVVWYLNGARISTPQLLLTPGVYTLQAIAGERVEKVNLFVKSKP